MSRRRNRRKRHPLLTALVILGVLAAGIWFGGRAVLRTMYPLKYSESITACAIENELPPSLLYATVRAESGFRPGVSSSVGATGLMQLTEAAFSEAQKKRDGSVTLDTETLTDPVVNLRYGSFYLRQMCNRFGNTETALAAYNAGPNRVAGWLKDSSYSTDGVVLTHIPYAETEHYVQRILRGQQVYQWLYAIE